MILKIGSALFALLNHICFDIGAYFTWKAEAILFWFQVSPLHYANKHGAEGKSLKEEETEKTQREAEETLWTLAT